LANPDNLGTNFNMEGKKAGTHHTDKNSVKRWRDMGEETTSEKPMLETLMLIENADSAQKLLQLPVVQEHVESWHMCRSKCH